jgi:uridine kinase
MMSELPNPVGQSCWGPAACGTGRPVIRACIDGFGRPRADRYRRGQLSPEGYWLDAFDYPALRANLLEPLGPGGSRRYRTATFDVRTDQPRSSPRRVAPPDAVLVLDGVFLLRPELNDAWDLRVFLEVGFQETLRRAVAHDHVLFGSAQVTQERHQRRYTRPAQLPGHRPTTTRRRRRDRQPRPDNPEADCQQARPTSGAVNKPQRGDTRRRQR